MKVAFIFMHPFSESMGSVVRVRELAFSLGKAGVEVYIFTPYEQSFDLFPKVHVISISNLVNSLGLSKTVYKFSKLLYYNKIFPSLFSSMISNSNLVMTKFVKQISRFLLDNGVNLIQVEQDAAIPIGIALKKETGLPLVVDIHNISSEELVAVGVLKKDGAKFLALQNMTKKCLSETDHVVVVNEYMLDYVIEHFGLSAANVSIVPPGGRSYSDSSVVRKRYKPFKVVYAGLVAHRERVDLFVQSMTFISRQSFDVEFYITNKGDAIKNIKKIARTQKVYPDFFWYDDYRKVNRFLSSCHIGVLPSSDDTARKLGTPIKLFNYMSVGLPVVASNIGGWANIIEEEGVGLLVEKNNPSGFAEAIKRLLGDKCLREELSFNALNAIEKKYNWDTSAKILHSLYENIGN